MAEAESEASASGPDGAMTRANIPWLRVGVEVVTIVGSILLAFWLQAWWDGRQDQQAEAELIGTLAGDLRATQVEVERVVNSHEVMAAALGAFLSLTPEQLAALPEDSASVILAGLPGVAIFTATDATVRGGDLSLLRDRSFRDAIATWTATVEDVTESLPILFSTWERAYVGMGSAAQLHLNAYVAPFDSPGAGRILQNLRGNEEFLAARLALQFAVDIDRRKVGAVSEQTARVLALVEGQRN